MTVPPSVVRPSPAPSTSPEQAVDVSPPAIASLVAEGARLVSVPPSVVNEGGSSHDLLIAVTHDLRSPLSSMLVLLERLRAGGSGPVTPLQEQQLGLLYAATFGMASLANDALDMAAGRQPALTAGPPVTFSLRDVWDAIQSLVRPIAEEKGLVLRFAGPPADRRLGHPAALHRILLNLVTNALKCTDAGSVTVSVRAVSDEELRFEVQDTGTGLPPALRARLVQTPPGSHAMPSSGGLGLAMCQQLLAAMDSTLVLLPPGAATTPGNGQDGPARRTGACLGFTLRLPAAP